MHPEVIIVKGEKKKFTRQNHHHYQNKLKPNYFCLCSCFRLIVIVLETSKVQGRKEVLEKVKC